MVECRVRERNAVRSRDLPLPPILNRKAFWAALGICGAAHCLLVWILFGFLFTANTRVSILLWSPLSIGEYFVLLIVVLRLYRLLSNDHNVYKIKA